ncbi:CAP domain-containing protein [Thioflexithrix psekupsensis]|uniref:CAP domain-containing protein n=1 Tax=Thioflexithrix psekupsensis TaxID=1570016 RepID=UPI003CCA38F6
MSNSTPASAVNFWMSHPNGQESILNQEITEIGFGYNRSYSAQVDYWVLYQNYVRYKNKLSFNI